MASVHFAEDESVAGEEDFHFVIGKEKKQYNSEALLLPPCESGTFAVAGGDEEPTARAGNVDTTRRRMPRRASRSIDDFYGRAHDHFEWAGPFSIFHFLSKRASYHACYLALGMINGKITIAGYCRPMAYHTHTLTLHFSII